MANRASCWLACTLTLTSYLSGLYSSVRFCSRVKPAFQLRHALLIILSYFRRPRYARQLKNEHMEKEVITEIEYLFTCCKVLRKVQTLEQSTLRRLKAKKQRRIKVSMLRSYLILNLLFYFYFFSFEDPPRKK